MINNYVSEKYGMSCSGTGSGLCGLNLLFEVLLNLLFDVLLNYGKLEYLLDLLVLEKGAISTLFFISGLIADSIKVSLVSNLYFSGVLLSAYALYSCSALILSAKLVTRKLLSFGICDFVVEL
jgi:hypothetical protein